MSIYDRTYKVKCRNPNCPNPAPDNVFPFRPGDYLSFQFLPLGLGKKKSEEDTLIATCPWCKWQKKILVREDDPDNKIY